MKLSDIDKGIAQIKGIASNLNERVQMLAVAIVEHKIDHNDCSRALALVNALSNTTNRGFLVRWFMYFGAIGLDLNNQKVRNIIDGRNYRPPNLDGAKANNWYEAFNSNGERAEWYEGPNPARFVPNTLGDLGQNVIGYADRFIGTDKKTGQLYASKDDGAGKQVPIYDLTDHEKTQAEQAFRTLRKLGLALMAREEAEAATHRVVELNEFVDEVQPLIEKFGKVDTAEVEELDNDDNTPMAERVTG